MKLRELDQEIEQVLREDIEYKIGGGLEPHEIDVTDMDWAEDLVPVYDFHLVELFRDAPYKLNEGDILEMIASAVYRYIEEKIDELFPKIIAEVENDKSE